MRFCTSCDGRRGSSARAAAAALSEATKRSGPGCRSYAERWSVQAVSGSLERLRWTRRSWEVEATTSTWPVCRMPQRRASGYRPLARSPYHHRPESLRATRLPPHVAMPRVHRAVSLLKRWWLATYHGDISDPHLEYSLDEVTFRFNRRTSRARGLLLYRLLQQAVELDPTPYHQIRGGDPNMKW